MAGDVLEISELDHASRFTTLRFDLNNDPRTHTKYNAVTPSRSPAAFLPAGLTIDETELSDVSDNDRIPNNTLALAQRIPLGFDEGEMDSIDIRGDLIEPTTITLGQNSEAQPGPLGAIDDGSIRTANQVFFTVGTPVAFNGVLNDSPIALNNANPTGIADAINAALPVMIQPNTTDGDFYEFEEVEAGSVLSGHVRSNSDAALILYDSRGTVLAVSDDINSNQTPSDSFINFNVSEFGTYYFAVVPSNPEFGFLEPGSPFDASTVKGGRAGPYTLTAGVDAFDLDLYAVELEAGDIIGVNSLGAANQLSLIGPDGSIMVTSGRDRTALHPPNSPLPGGGVATVSYVIDEPGTYYIRADGAFTRGYQLETRLFRPVLERAGEGVKQILFLDFDGAQINPATFGGPSQLAVLSPLSRFVGRFGLRDEAALIDRIVDVVEESLVRDLQQFGNNPNFALEIRNSKDHPDPTGQAHVSRVIVGGTIGELGIGTVGIAQSVDVGNFNTEEQAVVLLDLLSNPRFDPNSLNQYPVAPGATRLDLVAEGVGNIVAHEAGHFFGAWHTDQFNLTPNLMDQGGNLTNTVGVGEDLIWGTPDDIDVDFVEDEFVANERYFGRQNTLQTLAFALTQGTPFQPPVPQRSLSGMVFDDQNGNGFLDAGEPGISGARVYIDTNNDLEFGIGEPTVVSGSDGLYQLPTLSLTNSSVRVIVPPGQQLTFPNGGHIIDPANPPAGSLNFGLQTSSGSSSGVDLGDAPASYGAASHAILGGLSLGALVDGEIGVIADDGPDDDGISLSSLVRGATASGTATVSTGGQSPGALQGWIDFNGDGVFGSSEQVVRDLLVSGSTSFSFNVPITATPGATFARFRYGYERGIGPTGAAIAGEVEDYPVTILLTGDGGGGGGGGGGSVAPNAANDVLTVPGGASNVDIEVLANDTAGSGSPVVISLGAPSQGGVVSIAPDQQSVLYTPAPTFSGTETFTYTISNGVGSDTAIVSVTVTDNSGGGGGGGGGGNGDQVIRFRLQAVDATGAPVTTSTVGSEIRLQAFTDDLRADGIGVFAAYLDVEFDPSLATVSGDVVFGGDYPSGQIVDLSTPGLLNEIGAFAGLSNNLGSDEVLLFTVPLTVTAPGSLTFSSNPADVLPAHDVLLGDSLDAVPGSQIDFTSTTITVSAAGPSSAFTNLQNPLDVNNDGSVTPRDALMVINELNGNGSRPLGASVLPVADAFIDVNGDRHLSSVDALLIINFLNRQSALAAALPANASQPQVASASSLAAATVDLAMGDDDDELDDILDQIGDDAAA